MSDDEEFDREFRRARANDHLRTGPTRFAARPKSVEQPDWNAPPPGACTRCQGDLNAYGFCKPCRLEADAVYADELYDLCQEAVRIQRHWFKEGKPEAESAAMGAWNADRKWLRASGFRLTVQAIEERWNRPGKVRKAKEEDL